jgi:hypothetical protein
MRMARITHYAIKIPQQPKTICCCPFPNVGKKTALLSSTAMICDVSDKNNPSQNAAHHLYYKHICRKTVATGCVSQERSFTDLVAKRSSSASPRAMPRSSARQTGGRNAANRDKLAAMPRFE